MAQLTQSLIDEFSRAHARGEHAPMTVGEEVQLVWAWEELQRLNAMLAPTPPDAGKEG